MSLRCAHSPEDIKKRFKRVTMFRNKLSILYCSILIISCFSTLGQNGPGSKVSPLSYGNILSDEMIISEINNENKNLKRALSWLDVVDLNLVTLRQMGQQNQATINQISDVNNPNMVLVNQNGNNNKSDIDQTGNHNVLNLNQKGNMNSFSGSYEGEYLINSIEQRGNQNLIEQHLQGSNMDFSIIQHGNGHEVIQTENGSGIGYKVTQTGQAMKVSIDQGHVMIK